MTNKQTPTSQALPATLPILTLSSLCHAASSLGEISTELRGSVMDFTCVVIASDSNKPIELGTWPTKQLQTNGNTTQPVAFTLRLEGCPPGSASVTLSGIPTPDTTLLTLDDAMMAQKVAIEPHSSDRMRLPLEQASQTVGIDENDNVTLTFLANHIALVGGVQPDLARVDATSMANYNQSIRG